MSENILEKIIKKKIEKMANLKKTISLDSLNELLKSNKTFINFKEKIENNLKKNKFSIIAEIKKASPSAGIIIDNYDPVKIANIYNDNNRFCTCTYDTKASHYLFMNPPPFTRFLVF